MTFSSDEFPPKVMQFFEQARHEAVEQGMVEPTPSADVAAGPEPTPPPAAPPDTPPMIFKKVDFFRSEGEKEKKFDARMALYPGRREIIISDEKRGEQKHVYARIPYDRVTELAYEKSKHRRWKTAVLLSPLALFAKGKKHWLTIAFEGVEELPQNFVYLRLDKKNFRQILSALEAQTGLEPSVTVEE